VPLEQVALVRARPLGERTGVLVLNEDVLERAGGRRGDSPLSNPGKQSFPLAASLRQRLGRQGSHPPATLRLESGDEAAVAGVEPGDRPSARVQHVGALALHVVLLF
jgi:hypothetical protein